MKDLGKKCLRLTYENYQLKKRLAKQEEEYLELAQFIQEYITTSGPSAKDEDNFGPGVKRVYREVR